MKTVLKLTSVILLISALLVCAVSCNAYNEPTGKARYDYNSSATGNGTEIKNVFVKSEINSMKVEDFIQSNQQSDYVLIKIKNYGDIVAVLRHDVAPLTVENFKKLVSEGFYDGTAFHRVIENFMIQGGGSYIVESENGGTEFKAKESPAIYGEFTQNGFENNLRHLRGVLSMARTSEPNSASSQFFIMHQLTDSAVNLDGKYATFGYVLAGMDVVDAIATCEVFGDSDAPIPLEDVVIESITFVEPK